MSAKDGPRDWDKELAEIDKLIASGAGDAPPPTSLPAGAKARASAAPAVAGAAPRPPAVGGRHAVLFTWVRLGLAITLGVGMTQWPYTHGCGLPLYGYLAAVAALLIASFWSMISSWRTRSAVAHFLSIALLFWGVTLGAREVLPRVGYAKQSATWACVATAPAAAPPPVSPAVVPASPAASPAASRTDSAAVAAPPAASP